MTKNTLASAFTIIVLLALPIAASAAPQPADYVRASGASLVIGSDEKRIFLRGVSFGNGVWSNPPVAPQTDHGEADFRLLRDSNLNAVRFYLNYGIFEDDAKPYQYKQSGFDWLDRNIAWAEKYDVYLILNMHFPQGGYQSGGGGMGLWDSPENSKRLVALWRAVAEHCRDRTHVAGYGLLNEPYATTSLRQWQDLANAITRAVRSVDPNHLLFVERLMAVKGQDSSWGDLNFFRIDDGNAAYEFHFYEPFEYTHQYASWVDSVKDVEGGVYPDETRTYAPPDAVWAGWSESSPLLPTGTKSWKEYNGDFRTKYTVRDSSFILGKAAFEASALGPKGACWFDDYEIKEFSPDGSSRTVAIGSFDSKIDGWFWSKDQSGTAAIDPDGHTARSMRIEGTRDFANYSLSGQRFAVKTGYAYAIRGWYRSRDVAPTADVRFRVDFDTSPSGAKALSRNKEYLASRMGRFLAWGKSNNVPLLMGEYGLHLPCFQKDEKGVDRGGVNWVRDMAALIVENDLNATYHSWHESDFGIFHDDATRLPDPSAMTPGILETFKLAYGPAGQAPPSAKERTGVAITAFRLTDVFPVFYSWYSNHPVGAVTVRNWDKEPATDVSVSFWVKEYMVNPSTVKLAGTLGPGQERQIDLVGLFTNKLLDLSQGSLASANVTLEYAAGGKPTRREYVQNIRILDRNALTWDDDRKVAAFVNSKDPTVMTFARNVTSALREKTSKSMSQSLAIAMGIHEALSLYGMAYATDPASAYEQTSRNRLAVDFLQFPQQTIQYRTGDCDDLSILYCALLESVGVETAFITIPGHITMAFSVSMRPAEARLKFPRADQLIFQDERTWVPVEVTQRAGGFMKAWDIGAREWRENAQRGQANLYPTREAWQVYQPVGLDARENPITLPAAEKIQAAFAAEVQRFIHLAISLQETRLKGAIRQNPKDMKSANQLGILYAQYGLYDKAEVEFRRITAQAAYVPALLNLGNISFLKGDARKALESYEKAYRVAPGSPRVLLAVARANQELENYGSAREAYGKLKAVDTDLAQQFAYLDLQGDESRRAADAAEVTGTVLWEGQ